MKKRRDRMIMYYDVLSHLPCTVAKLMTDANVSHRVLRNMNDMAFLMLPLKGQHVHRQYVYMEENGRIFYNLMRDIIRLVGRVF